MNYSEWEPTYRAIRDDFGFEQSDDELSVRIMRAVSLNLDLIDADDLSEMFGRNVTVVGNGPNLEDDFRDKGVDGLLIVSGSAVRRVMVLGYVPDIITTDLDGDIDAQLDASSKGSVTAVLAHGDNQELISRYLPLLKGRVILTTQSVPQDIVFDFGGFTDGDRAVCMAAHMGARRIRLLGFDFEHPTPKPGTDPEIKRRKLRWARHIIEGVRNTGISIE